MNNQAKEIIFAYNQALRRSPGRGNQSLKIMRSPFTTKFGFAAKGRKIRAQ